ncbi:MAG: hypothetical protein WCI48_10245 [Bacteroidota bacterium]|jgi:hypothetical protein
MKMKNVIILGLLLVIASAGCKKKTPDPGPTYYYANAQIGGVNKSFKTTASFSKFCLLTGVCNTFYSDPSNQNINVLSIGLPVTVKAGVTYTSDSSHTQMMYIDMYGKYYYSSSGDSLNINVTKWEGHGGTGAGTFSGKLRLQGSVDSIYIKNGTFSSLIWFTVGK